MKFKGNWDKLQTKICLSRQSWTKYMKQSKEIKENWTRAENFYKCSSVISDPYYKSFHSEEKTEH